MTMIVSKKSPFCVVSGDSYMHTFGYSYLNIYITFIPFLESYRKAYGIYPKTPVAEQGMEVMKTISIVLNIKWSWFRNTVTTNQI